MKCLRLEMLFQSLVNITLEGLTDELVAIQSDVREGPDVAKLLRDSACVQSEPIRTESSSSIVVVGGTDVIEAGDIQYDELFLRRSNLCVSVRLR